MSNEKNNLKYNVVIVGSGFSGIVAAGILAGHDLNILLVDENIHLGGQLLRKIPVELGNYSSYHPEYIKRIGFGFVENIKNKKITIMNRTCLTGIYPGNLLMLESGGKEVISVSYDVLLFATGARERFLPFKGWNLPGIYSTGLAQVLMKSSGVLPAKEMLIAGSGLFLYSVGYEFLKNKGKALGILELTGMMDKIKILPQLVHNFSKFAEGGKFLAKIFLSGVPVKYRSKIVEARGNGVLEEVVVGKTDASGKLIAGTEKIYKTNALAVGYGFVPNIEGPQLAGCDLEYSNHKGGWTVTVNEKMETSRENILAAGEITGVGGALKSINEGKIAGFSILHKFAKITDDDYQRQLKKLTAERKHHLTFMDYFNSLYLIPEGALLDIPDDTVVCRCEDITMGEIKKGINMGFNTSMGLKTAVRVSMGNCQGRTCGPIVFDLLSLLGKQAPDVIGPFHARPPLKPLSIAALANYPA
ncbi:MAG: NAD(P)/FAD-dependent oxidoreductase [Acidobacteria bacterium]|jgi:NADPH-dependent 2,4-dienoyl-CoA reductase/sulfur reductase-like enzyme|nr:NAD(P)/FAD-dependent oxidoreductase [Acidobacteriota bacterium]